ncbi:MAG: JAB domain-containing protein [Cyclobacteriaceae bacterium]
MVWSKELTQVCEVKVKYSKKVKPSERPIIKTAKDAYDLLLQTWDMDQIEFVEQFKVIYLNSRKRVLGIAHLSTGTTTQTDVDVRRVLTGAIKTKASCLILAHNHPSGDSYPSRADILVTKKIAKAGRLINIKVSDHVIITTDSYYSFHEMGEDF